MVFPEAMMLVCWGDIQLPENIGHSQEISVGKNLSVWNYIDGNLRYWDNAGVDISAQAFLEGLGLFHETLMLGMNSGDFDTLVPYKTEIDTQMSSYNQEVFQVGSPRMLACGLWKVFVFRRRADLYGISLMIGSRIYIDDDLFLDNDHKG